MDSVAREVFNNQLAIAKQLYSSSSGTLKELAHYIIDNLITKICIQLGIERNKNLIYKPIRPGKPLKTKDFPELLKDILFTQDATLKSKYEVDLTTRHAERNFFQHHEENIQLLIRPENVKSYIKIAENIMKELGIYEEKHVDFSEVASVTPSPRLVTPRSHRASGDKLKDMLQIAEEPVIITPKAKTQFNLKVTNIGLYSLKQLRANFIDNVKGKTYPLLWDNGEKKPRQIISNVPIGHSEKLIIFQFVKKMYFRFCVGDADFEFVPYLDLKFHIEFSASNAESWKKSYSARQLIKGQNFLKWKEKVYVQRLQWFASRLNSPESFDDLKRFLNRSILNDPKEVESIEEDFDSKWDQILDMMDIEHWEDLTPEFGDNYSFYPWNTQETIEKYVENRELRENPQGIPTPSLIIIFNWKNKLG